LGTAQQAFCEAKMAFVYSFTFNPSLLTSPKRKKQVAEILTEAEKYIWRIKEEMRCA